MTHRSVYVLTRSACWLKALGRMDETEVRLDACWYPYDTPAGLAEVLPMDPEGIFLLDAGLSGPAEAYVLRARELGWRFVVTVAALPDAGEAAVVLRAGAWDYWEKTYDPHDLLLQIKAMITEIDA